jgi:hypothetical protein
MMMNIQRNNPPWPKADSRGGVFTQEASSDAVLSVKREEATGTPSNTYKPDTASLQPAKRELDLYPKAATPREPVLVVEETGGLEKSATHPLTTKQDLSLEHAAAVAFSPAIGTVHMNAQGATITEIKATNYYNMGQGISTSSYLLSLLNAFDV